MEGILFSPRNVSILREALVLFSLYCFLGQLDTSQSSLGDGTLTDGMLPSDWPGSDAWGIFSIND